MENDVPRKNTVQTYLVFECDFSMIVCVINVPECT